MSDSFCIAPWMNLHLHPTGSLRPCCISQTHLASVREGATLQDAWNSEALIKLRREFLEGKRPESCSGCYNREAGGVESVRQQLNERYARINELELSSEIAPPSNLRQLDLSFTNDCNLTCRMCGPNCSSKWIGLAQKIPEGGSRDLWQWYKLDQWKPFEISAEWLLGQMKDFPEIHEFEIKGGEPFISKENDLLLEELSRHPKAKQLFFRYVSNGTYVSQATLKALEKFERVTIWVSVDGAGDLYRYIRGGKHTLERAEETIERFAGLPNANIGLVFTLSVYNIFGIAGFWDWYLRKKRSLPKLDLYPGFVNGPPYLSIRMLPSYTKEAALEKIPGGEHEFLISMRNALKAKYETESDPGLMAKFVEFTNTMDRLHGHSLLQVEPEFSKFISGLNSQS